MSVRKNGVECCVALLWRARQDGVARREADEHGHELRLEQKQQLVPGIDRPQALDLSLDGLGNCTRD